MKCRIKWLDHRSFVGESGSGHSVVMDGAPDAGGRNLGVRPMEMLLLGLGGCTAFDVVSILQKSRQDLVGCEVEIDAERAIAVGDGAGRHPARRDVERDVPGVVEPGRLGHAYLADDLRPHVQGGGRVSPFGER